MVRNLFINVSCSCSSGSCYREVSTSVVRSDIIANIKATQIMAYGVCHAICEQLYCSIMPIKPLTKQRNQSCFCAAQMICKLARSAFRQFDTCVIAS